MDKNFDYCRESVRNNDYDHYLIGLLMPRNVQPELWALGAFKHVIETIPASVSNPALGYMRLTWWRDQIANLEKGNVTKGQPILGALSQLVKNNPALLLLLTDFINEHEAIIETPDENFRASTYPHLLNQILGKEKPRYQKLENAATAIMKKHHGTKWENHPPFMALRLWFSQFLSSP